MEVKKMFKNNKNSNRNSSFLKDIENPTNNHRPLPFWSWNDQLDNVELTYQIKEMEKQGLGGYFMHARSGLKTSYLSEEWFDSIKTGIEQAKASHMEAWIYDEEGWPSGFAGGLVPAYSQEYQAKFIQMKKCKSIKEAMELIQKEDVLSVYNYLESNSSFEQISDIKQVSLKENESLLVVVRKINPYYVDTMNKEAIEKFTELTHDVYYERFKEEFGKTVKGFFTDEPRLTCDRIGDVAWSDSLPGAFLKHFEYDILAYLPALFIETTDFEKHRYNFWMMVNDMFVHSYMETLYDWCNQHDCQLTGHMMMEESIFSQMTSTGGVMPFYEYMHMPGIDWLRRPISSPVIAKQVGSVAAQLGLEGVLSESFALCGWDVSLEELKWIAEWQFVNGVNRICQHLEGYTIRGSRKRDYPPSLFIQQTWWEEYKVFNDYLGRLNVVLSQGEQLADVLLLHPMRSGYLVFDGTRSDSIRKLDDDLTFSCELLSGEHISYHFGDETIMEKHGRVENGSLVIGEVSYRSVVLPTMYAINHTTLHLLLEFIRSGGQVYSMGELPYFTNGVNEKLVAFNKQVKRFSGEDLRKELFTNNLLSLSIHNKNGEINDIHYQIRKCNDGILVYMVNLSKEKSYDAKINYYNFSGEAIKIDMNNGKEIPINVERKQNETNLGLHFDPMESHVILYKEVKDIVLSRESGWNLVEMDANSLTLDQCRYSIDEGETLGPIPVIALQQKLLDLKRPCHVKLFFQIDIRTEPGLIDMLNLVVEDIEKFEVEVNQRKVDLANPIHWKDKSFKYVSVKPWLKKGKNEIVLSTFFKQPQKVYDVLYGEGVYETEKNKITYDVELENIYLLGDFGVYSDEEYRQVENHAMFTKGDFYLYSRPTSFDDLEFTQQGLLFFAGTVSVEKTLNISNLNDQDEFILDLSNQRAPMIHVMINDKLVHKSYWAPYKINIKQFLNEGDNKITLKFFASNRNLFGPHHHINGECYNVGPDSFTGKWSWVERKSEADATEIFDREKNYWTDDYCFVTFGIYNDSL